MRGPRSGLGARWPHARVPRGPQTSLPLPPGDGGGASTRPVPEAARSARPGPWSGRFGGPAWRGEGQRPDFFPGFLLLRLRDLEKRLDSPRTQARGGRAGAGAWLRLPLSRCAGRSAPSAGPRRGCRHAPRGALLFSQTSGPPNVRGDVGPAERRGRSGAALRPLHLGPFTSAPWRSCANS